MGRVQTNFRAEDMGSGKKGEGEPRTESLTEVQYEETDGNADLDTQRENTYDASGALSVPAGSAGEIVRWVGDDKGKADLALRQEQGAAKPRKGLLDQLKEILEK